MKLLAPSFFFLSLTLVLMGCATAEPTNPSLALLPSATPPSLRATPTLAAPLQPVATVPAAVDSGSPAGQPSPNATLPADIAPVAPPATAIPPQLPSPTLPPLPDLPPADLLTLAQSRWHVGDTATAEAILRQLLQLPTLGEAERAEALYWLGRTAVESNDEATAVQAFRDQIASAAPNPNSHFFLGQLNAAAGNCPTAVAEYQLFLAAAPNLGAYIWPRIATCTAERAQVIAAYQQALTSEAHYLVSIATRRQLASFYREDGAYDAAIAQYAAIRTAAQTPQTKGEMTYLIGSTYILSGSLAVGYATYQQGVNEYPEAYESYFGLVALVEAEQPVDLYQRGLTNFYAQSYPPAIAAFTSYLEQTPTAADPAVHLFLAWSHEAVKEFPAALAQLEAYLATAPTDPEVIGRYYEEKAALETRSISVSQAIATLDEFVGQYPTHPRASWASWRTAVLADRFMGDEALAAARYLAHATSYPQDENAAEAQFRAGLLAWGLGDSASATAAWQQAAAQPTEWGRAAQVWLIDTLPADQAAVYVAAAAKAQGASYYTLRARDLGAGLPPFAALPANVAPPTAAQEAADELEVEQWIRTHFGLSPEAVVQSQLADGLAADPRLVRGTQLWEIGLYDEAKRELEAVRTAYADNAQLSYQLALYFRDLGLYRSSILAAVAVLTRAGVTVYDAPPLIGRLAYPTYYQELLLPLAEQYGYDPLLHFALLRQESLFEGFATSSALAQGLGQVIPATGEYIAQKLAWPNYVNEDLYRPYINLAFAAFYLDEQLGLFEGNTAAALAAYNAGPGNAAEWRTKAGNNHDFYVETVNFSETRLYIRNIYTWHAAYRFLYGGE